MEKVKEKLKFYNAASFYDYKNIGIFEELSLARKCIVNNFCETIPFSRILLTLSILDDVNLKINNNDIENNIESIHALRGKIKYKLSFEKVVREEETNETIS